MNKTTIKDKIIEVLTHAALYMRQKGHTHHRGKDAAKYIVAEAIKKDKHLTDRQLAEYLPKDEIGRFLGFKEGMCYSSFSVMRKRIGVKAYSDIYHELLKEYFRGKQLSLICQDSTDIPAFSLKDKDAKFGYRTPSKREQQTLKSTEKSYLFGYKTHTIVEVTSELPLAFIVAPANRHDSKFFDVVFNRVKSNFAIQYMAKFLADAAYYSTKILWTLRESDIIPVIASNGRRQFKSEVPKDKDYGKRWAVERVFSRLKEVFGMSKNRFIGIEKVGIHIISCLFAYFLRYAK